MQQNQMGELVVFDKLHADVLMVVQPLMALKVSDDDTCKAALEQGKKVSAFSKAIEAKYKELVAPYNDKIKEIRTAKDKILISCEQGTGHVKRELAVWEQQLAKRRQEEFEKAEKIRRQKELEAQVALEAEKEEADSIAMFGSEEDKKRLEITQTVAAERVTATIAKEHRQQEKAIESMKVSGTRQTWTFEITDAAAVPREYLVVNETAIRKAMNAGARDIPGVRIYQETKIAL